MIHRVRRVAAVLMSAGCVCAVTACGSSSSSTSTSSSAGPSFAGGHGGFSQLTSSERSCLSRHGVKLTAGGTGTHRPGGFGGGTGRPGGGKKPSFRHGGTPPKGAQHFQRAVGGTYEKALKACGVTLPRFGGGGLGGPGSGAPGAGSGRSTASQTSSAS